MNYYNESGWCRFKVIVSSNCIVVFSSKYFLSKNKKQTDNYLHGLSFKYVIFSGKILDKYFQILLILLYWYSVKPSTGFCLMYQLLRPRLHSCAKRHLGPDSRFAGTFRQLFVLLRNLHMKCRLIGDLETMGTIGRGIMNVSRLLLHVSRPVFSDGKPDAKKQLGALTGKCSLFHSQRVQREVFFFFFLCCLEFSKAQVQQFYRQIIS